MTKESSHKSPTEFICQWIAENKFQSIGFVGNIPTLPSPLNNEVELINCNDQKAWSNTKDKTVLQAVIVSDILENLSKQEIIQTLAGYRNALVEAILVIVPDEKTIWESTDFYSLGFKKLARFPHAKHPLQAFEYNLRTYNHKRLWNTPKYWANPENFGKYWW